MVSCSVPCAWAFAVLTKELGLESKTDDSLSYEKLADFLARTDAEESDELGSVTNVSDQTQDLDGNDTNTSGAKFEVPLFVTFTSNTKSRPGQLRGCKGTFVPGRIEASIEKCTILAAFHDKRFRAVSADELYSLTCSVTLLRGFEECRGLLDWELGEHGIRIEFQEAGKLRRATYLPHVMLQQNWTKEDAIIHAIRKSGSAALDSAAATQCVWTKAQQLDIKITRYKGSKSSMTYSSWMKLRDCLTSA